MLIDIANVLAGLVGIGIIVIGARVILRPQTAAGFGIPGVPAEDRAVQAWFRVKAVRDIASGVFTFILLVGGTPHLLGWFILAAAGIPVGDALIVLRSNGLKAVAYGIHGATAVVMLVTGVLLFVG
jgi:Domain of unknown function (DUF4267)